MTKTSENDEIITDAKNPIITTPTRIFPTVDNYGTCRFNRGEVIVCKKVAFQIQFISAKKISMRVLDKRFADELLKTGAPV